MHVGRATLWTRPVANSMGLGQVSKRSKAPQDLLIPVSCVKVSATGRAWDDMWVEWGNVSESHQSGASSIHQVSTNSDLVPVWAEATHQKSQDTSKPAATDLGPAGLCSWVSEMVRVKLVEFTRLMQIQIWPCGWKVQYKDHGGCPSSPSLKPHNLVSPCMSLWPPELDKIPWEFLRKIAMWAQPGCSQKSLRPCVSCLGQGLR